jgi:hypothetical protein
LPETVGLAVTTVTDEAVSRVCVFAPLDSAANQTAIIQVTDLGSGAYQRTTLLIARATATQAGFFTVPTSVTYTGPNNQQCASGIGSEIFVFGGTPPYTISNSAPSAFSTNTSVVNFSGGSFRVTPTGVCAENVTIAVTDTAARTVTVTLTNKLGTNDPPPAPLAVVPGSLSLTSCASYGQRRDCGRQDNHLRRGFEQRHRPRHGQRQPAHGFEGAWRRDPTGERCHGHGDRRNLGGLGARVP